MKKVRGYISSRAFMGDFVPVRVQNRIVRDFCEKNKLDYLLSSVEYCMKDSFIILNGVLSEIKEIDGIISYSMFQLPHRFF